MANTVTKFAIAQMNPTVGDYLQNSKKIIRWVDQAEKQGADLIVFPEVALSGYPVWDLANKRSFVQKGLEYLQKITRETTNKRITVALGYIDQGTDPSGRSHNAMAWIHQGKITARQFKRLLPTYDVFLEDIFFQPATESKVISWKNWQIGPTICEDLWDSRYPQKPVADLCRSGADLIINISASPFYQGVDKVREELLCRHTTQHRVPMLYVNQVGGQDDLIFDGRSFFMDAQGNVLFQAPAFEEGLFFFEWNDAFKLPVSQSPSKNDSIDEIYHALVLGIRDYCRKNRFDKALIGLSGGIDSAMVAVLACEALGADALTGISMPNHYSSKGSWADSRELAKRLKIKFSIHPIDKIYDTALNVYHAQLKADRSRIPKKGQITLAMENLQARIRGLHLMYLSNDQNRLLLSTGNKSELAMGYCTLYGDMAGGLCVIGDVYKTQIYRLAKYVNRRREIIPAAILEKAPSAELRPNQMDQDSLPPYDVLDEILYLYIEKNFSGNEIIEKLTSKKVTASLVRDVVRKVDQNEYKRRQAPPILRVTEKAWFGRRMPLTNRFEN